MFQLPKQRFTEVKVYTNSKFSLTWKHVSFYYNLNKQYTYVNYDFFFWKASMNWSVTLIWVIQTNYKWLKQEELQLVLHKIMCNCVTELKGTACFYSFLMNCFSKTKS